MYLKEQEAYCVSQSMMLNSATEKAGSFHLPGLASLGPDSASQSIVFVPS